MGKSQSAKASAAHSAQATLKKREKKLGRHSYGRGEPQQKRSTITPPPPGWTFLSIGHPELAAKCKELSKEQEVDVKVVSATNIMQDVADRISNHLHRIGYHIRNDIFDEACTWLGYREVNGKLVKAPAFDPTSGFERTLARYGADMIQLGAVKATNEESERVKGAIRELFPKIPDDALTDIFETAWQKGASTIGNVETIPLARRVQLAVIAHIRHTYTDYDRILQTSSWMEARKAVEPYCLAKLVEWRGEEAGDDDGALEDILQHAVVLSGEESVAEHSEPDRYADNEDSESDYAPESAHAAITHVQPSSTPQLSVQQKERERQALRARWANARSLAAQGIQPGPAAGPPALGNALFASLPLITVPTDAKGRAPKRFVQDGVQYTRVTREQLASFGIIPPQQAQPMMPQFGAPFATQQFSQHPQLPPQRTGLPSRLFDEHGREVFLDPIIHQLTPASMVMPGGSVPMGPPQLAPGPLSYNRVRTVSPEASVRSSQAIDLTSRRGANNRHARIHDKTTAATTSLQYDDSGDEYDPSKPLVHTNAAARSLPHPTVHPTTSNFAATPAPLGYPTGIPLGLNAGQLPQQGFQQDPARFMSATPVLPNGHMAFFPPPPLPAQTPVPGYFAANTPLPQPFAPAYANAQIYPGQPR